MSRRNRPGIREEAVVAALFFPLALFVAVCYLNDRKDHSFSAARNGRRSAPRQGAASCPLILGKGDLAYDYI